MVKVDYKVKQDYNSTSLTLTKGEDLVIHIPDDYVLEAITEEDIDLDYSIYIEYITHHYDSKQ